MTVAFDAYHLWLGIPPAEQPPNHYRLQGLQLNVSDPAVIDHAFDRQMSIPMKGPDFQKTVSSVKLKLMKTAGDNFNGSLELTSLSGRSTGNKVSLEITGTLSQSSVEWKGKNSGSGTVKNGAMCVSSEEPPFSSEMWLIPAAEVVRPALLAGKHRVFDERGAYAFDISLFENGTAQKSHAPKIRMLPFAPEISIAHTPRIPLAQRRALSSPPAAS